MTDWKEVEEPKVWVSRFPAWLDIVYLDPVTDGDLLEFIQDSQDRLALASQEDAPKYLYFEAGSKLRLREKDAFKIIDGLLVISPELRDVLVQFDLGQTQLFEVPIYKNVKKKPSDLPNHFVLNVHAPKDTLLPELSEKYERPIRRDETEPRPGVKWRPENSSAVAAVRAESCEGADMWHDPNVRNVFFMSDRLKHAIDAAKLKTKALDLTPARVFEPV